MANRVLPSRDLVRTDIDTDHDFACVTVHIGNAYASGRLLDREAINREGARATAADVLHCDVSTPEIDLILDTALGVTD